MTAPLPAGAKAYLRVLVGGQAALVPREAVASVGMLSGPLLPVGASMRLDRNRLYVDAARLLGLGTLKGPGVTALRLAGDGGSAPHWFCLVNRVERIETRSRADIHPLPPALAALRRWLAGVTVDEASEALVCVLHARPALGPRSLLSHLRRAAIDPRPLREDQE